MSAQDVQHLYSLPYEKCGMVSNNYNDLSNKPLINGVTLVGDKSLPEIGIPTKTSDLVNDSGFITRDAIPTKTSDLTNDSGFTTQTYVDSEIDSVEEKLSKYDGITVVKNFLVEDTFTSTFDDFITTQMTKLQALKSSLASDEFVEIRGLKINTIGNLTPTEMTVITPSTDLLTLDIDWQGFTYYNNVVKAIDIVNKKVLTLTMINDTNDDSFVSYYNDSTTYTFKLQYTVYKTISLV